jgi:hypothetical protein
LVRERIRLENGKGTRRTAYTVENGGVTWEGDSYVHPVREWLNQDKALLGMYGTTPFLELLGRVW